MPNKGPNFLQMIRAPFLTSILSPLLIGTLVSVYITGRFYFLECLLVFIMGIALHIATNVYNDIYDTKQGTDRVNVHRNEFSGGSGILIRYPELVSRMIFIARMSLVLAFMMTLFLMLLIPHSLWIPLWGIFLLAAFLSKYYTAAPVKLAYRGLGEIFVWFAFGPMAVLIAAVSQHVGFHPVVLLIMPVTGLSTLSILLIGELIDSEADREGGKWGVAVRQGAGFTRWVYGTVQLLLVVNIVVFALFVIDGGWFLLVVLIPYIIIFPKVWQIVMRHYNDPERLKVAARINVQIHLLFSLLINLGLSLMVILNG